MTASDPISHIQKTLLRWYEKNARLLPWRSTNDIYAIWVSEVMLQQTQVATVIPYYEKFLKKFPDVQSLATARQQTVLKLWEGLGYYARARNLHRAAGIVVSQHQGVIPQQWDQFNALPGVGDYIASAVLSIAAEKPYAVVDGNVKRVLSRMFVLSAPVNHSPSHRTYKKMAESMLFTTRAGDFNQAMMELGALICTPGKPACSDCPVCDTCLAYVQGQTAVFPKRLKRQAVPEYRVVAGVIFKNNRVLITQRKPNGLLGGLWEFPGGKIKAGETPDDACIREIKEETNLHVAIDTHLTRVRHAYTHFKIIMDVFCCRYLSGRVTLSGPVAHRWISAAAVSDYPFPRANIKFFPQLTAYLGKL